MTGCASIPKPIEWAETIRVEATAYCPCEICCKQYADGLTATGRDAYEAGVAVDPAIIPLGSHLDIPNYPRGPNGNGSWILADDVGVKGFHIDVRFENHQDALQFGHKWITVRVYPKGKEPKK